MVIEIIPKKELLRDPVKFSLSHEAWLYAARTKMTKEEWWTPDKEYNYKKLVEFFEESYLHYRKRVIEDCVFCTLAYQEKEALGILLVNKKENKFTIFDLGVEKNHQGRGIASFLLGHTVDYVFENYPDAELYSYVKPENVASKRVHEKAGFLTNEEVSKLGFLEYQYDKTNLKRKIKK